MNPVLLRIPALAALLVLCAATLTAQTWRPMGPPGGDVRTLAADPNDARHIYLGTSDGHIFGSSDAGDHWELLGRAGTRLDSVVSAIVVDPRRANLVYAATWTQDASAGGGIFRSEDAGRTWTTSGLAGEAVRALDIAPSNPDILVAGTLTGVFRTSDAGRTWQRISPEGHEELRNLDSIAIDPRDPDVIYAGTFHLPWKTTDGGRTWSPIHRGMIDDSDVMSILVDRANPRRVFASACSGIYRSENAGALWQKIQGIPYTARRTLAIRQDPADAATVYAATTEGLWKSSDGGAAWRRMTPHDWVITSLVLALGSSPRIVIGTERLGALVSDDGGARFRAANAGFNHRQILALALDPQRPARVLAVLANAPEPVLATEDDGATWAPLGPGLSTLGLRRVYSTPGGWWAALEAGGFVRYDEAKRAWVRAGFTLGEAAQIAAAILAERARPGNWSKNRNAAVRGPVRLEQQVNDMAFSSTAWYAATEHGLLASTDHGATWSIFPVGPMTDLPVRSVRVSADNLRLWVVTLRGIVFCDDGGRTWSWRDLPLDAGGAERLDVAQDAEGHALFVAAAGHGLYLSKDEGRTWRAIGSGLPHAPVQDFAIAGPVFLASMKTRGLFLSRDFGATWSRIEGTLAEGFFPVINAPPSTRAILAASATDGLYAVELSGALARSPSISQAPQ